MRGSRHLGGVHPFRIDSRGARVFPRFESCARGARQASVNEPHKLSTGVAGLDEMLLGGVLSGSTTLLLGAPGSGKTALGLSFLAAGAQRDEPGVYFGFYEPPQRLLAKGDGLGLRITDLVEEGKLSICRQSPIERIVDDLVQQMLAVVKRTGARRLFIDGLDGFALAAAYPVRLPTFFTALSSTLRARGVTTFVSQEAALFSPETEVPMVAVLAAVENIFFLRYVEYGAQLRRVLSILKVRESAYDTSLRELWITPRGIEVASTFESAEAILSGSARTGRPAPRKRKPRNGGPR